jgi:hypothetical protein
VVHCNATVTPVGPSGGSGNASLAIQQPFVVNTTGLPTPTFTATGHPAHAA